VQSLDVGDQRRPLGERPAAHLANVRLEAGVRDHVALQAGGRRELHFAHAAPDRIGAEVVLPVRDHGGARVEAFIAAVALEAALVLVAIHVLLQEQQRHEATPTHAALVAGARPAWLVRLHVVVERLFHHLLVADGARHGHLDAQVHLLHVVPEAPPLAAAEAALGLLAFVGRFGRVQPLVDAQLCAVAQLLAAGGAHAAERLGVPLLVPLQIVSAENLAALVALQLWLRPLRGGGAVNLALVTLDVPRARERGLALAAFERPASTRQKQPDSLSMEKVGVALHTIWCVLII
jgi:hypothetical protein